MIPDRTYYLLSGPLSKIGDLYVQLWGQAPNVWWPDDRAWIVATEIYFGWTYVAGSVEAIDAVLADPRLEAFRAQPTHQFTSDSDALNAGLDAD